MEKEYHQYNIVEYIIFFEIFHLICFQTMTSYKKEVPIKFT